MVFEHIEKLKRDFTDKYVVVDVTQPELQRFDGQTGQIKTVNMNGRALVEFGEFNNIGWFDISLDFLKVVDKPVEVEKPKKAPAKKPAAKAAPAAKADGAKAGGAKPGGGMSVADMLAAARGEKSADAKPAAKPAAEKADKKMSVADMLAAARAEKSGEAAPAAEPEPVAEPEPEAAAETAAPAASSKADLPTDVAGIAEYCRGKDGG